jgi:hypothetical protein
LLIAGIFIVGFILLGVISIAVWEATNTSAFCANVCHDVHPEEPTAYQDSYHAEVKCVECHMGRVSTLRKIVLKASHARHLPETLFGQYGRPTEAETLIPPDQSCERCHWPPSFHGDSVREIAHYQQDRQNTLIRTYFALRTGSGGAQIREVGEGIHWHVANQVEFIPVGERNENIHWVRATFPDGRTVEYHDVVDPLTDEQIAAAEPTVMSCVDCHNQVGHPFYSPDRLVDMALETGRLSAELPYVKREMHDLLTRDYENQEQALEAMETLRSEYEAEYPQVAESYQDEIEQAIDVGRELIQAVIFETAGLTWESFPDHSGHGGHKPFPGCFRCHNGTLQSDDGDWIRLECNLCHSIPVKAVAPSPPPDVPAAKLQGPPSHQAVDFVAEHRWQADESCGECHGQIEFGTDDTSFCANSACHAQEWPELDLDPTYDHPIPLVGAHAEVWCHDCHEGVREPEYRCANCHEPPPDHYGDQCETCHTPVGWTSLTVGERGEVFNLADHAFPLDHGGADRDCRLCHPGLEVSTYTCFICHEPQRTRASHDNREITDIFAKCVDCHP